MSFGDFLTGASVGNAEQVERRRVERRSDEDRAIGAKQDLGKLVLEGLVSGRVRPEFGSHVLGELGKLSEPRKAAGGLEGFLGGTQQPDTPNLDTLTNGGWEQAFLSPQEQAAQDLQTKIQNDDQFETASMRAKLKRLPEFKQQLMTTMGISDEMANAAAIKIMYGENMFGATGAAGEYYDEAAKRIFRGQKDPIRGVIDVTTNLVVPNARAVKTRTQDNWQTGAQMTIDDYTGDVLATAEHVVPGARPFSPFFVPQLGGAYQMQGNQPVFTPGRMPDGSAPPLTGAGGGLEQNPDFEKWKFHLQQIDQAAEQEVRARTQNNDPAFIGSPTALQHAMGEAKDRFAKQWGYANYQELVTKLGGVTTRIPRAPAGAGAGVSRTPGNASPGAPQVDGYQRDKNGATYKITPGGN